MDQKTTTFDPKGVTSWRDSLQNTVRIVINLLFELKKEVSPRSTLELSDMCVMFSVYGDAM